MFIYTRRIKYIYFHIFRSSVWTSRGKAFLIIVSLSTKNGFCVSATVLLIVGSVFVSSPYTRPTFRNTSLMLPWSLPTILCTQVFSLSSYANCQNLMYFSLRFALFLFAGSILYYKPRSFLFSSTSSDLYEIEVFCKLNWKLPRLTFLYHSLTHILPFISLCTTLFLFKLVHTAVPSPLTLFFVWNSHWRIFRHPTIAIITVHNWHFSFSDRCLIDFQVLVSTICWFTIEIRDTVFCGDIFSFLP